MRTLVVTHYFPPEVGAPQARLSGLAAAWAAAGDEVTVLTGFPNHPQGIVHPGYRGKLRMREKVDGYSIARTWLYATRNEGFFRKTLGHLSFMVSSIVLGARMTGPADVVVVSSPTFFSILSAWVLARVKRARFVIEVRDLWPAIFVELGVLRNRRLIRALEAVELASYRAADAIVVVTQGFLEDIVRRGISSAKVHVIRNSVDIDRFGRAGEAETMRERLGASPGNILVLYAGAHGISHALPKVADAAALLRQDSVHFAFVGDGAAKTQLADHVSELKLTNVTMIPSVPHQEMPTVLAAADICLVPLRDVPLFSTFIPSKMFEYMAASKPIIGSLRGESASILREAGADVVEPEDPTALANAIKALIDDPGRRAAMGRAAREFVATRFDRRSVADKYRQIIHQVVDLGP